MNWLILGETFGFSLKYMHQTQNFILKMFVLLIAYNKPVCYVFGIYLDFLGPKTLSPKIL